MAYTAIYRHAQISVRKVRPLVDLIRGQRAAVALEILKYQPQRGARMVEKVLKSALGNAEDRRAPHVASLVVTDARADGASIMKRMRPRARGMAHVIKKRMTHITISVDSVLGATPRRATPRRAATDKTTGKTTTGKTAATT